MRLTAEEQAVVITNCDWLCAVERKMMLTLSRSAMPEVAGCYTLAARKQKIKGRGQGG